MKPTMQDVADFARVSRATVSRVLADSVNVSPDKRALVLEAVQKLGYRPHKKMRTNIQILVGAAPAQENDPFYAEIVCGIERGLKINRVRMHMELSQERFVDAIANACEEFHGVLLIGNANLHERVHNYLKQHNIPMVVIHGVGGAERYTYVNIEERRAMIEIISELAQLGHTDIAYIHGPNTDINYQERIRAFKLGMLSAHLSVNPQFIVYAPGWDEESGLQAAVQLLTDRRPSAIITANDLLAMGVYQALNQAGLKIPQDVSVIGFGDLECAKHMRPPLNTIAVPLQSIGEWAVASLCAQINDENLSPARLTVPTVYRKRQSVAKANRNQ